MTVENIKDSINNMDVEEIQKIKEYADFMIEQWKAYYDMCDNEKERK